MTSAAMDVSTARRKDDDAVAPIGFVALSRFEVREGWEGDVTAAFRSRPHLVDDAPGFVRLEVLRPNDRPTEFWLFTYWTDEASFLTWHRDHRKQAHHAIPKGLKLVPGSARVDHLDHVAS